MKTITTLYFHLTVLLSVIPALAVQSQESTLEPVAVQVTQVTEQEMVSTIEIVGTLQALQRATLAAKVTGVVTAVPVTLGSAVEQGDLLVKISAEEISAKLYQAKAQLDQAKRNLEREQKLLKKNATTAETVKTMKEVVAVAQAGFLEAETMLGYTTITAPFSGVVTEKNVYSGDLATPGAHLLRLENNEKIQVLTAVPENLVLQINQNDPLTVKIPAAGLEATGRVAEIAPVVDPNSRTASVTIDLPPSPQLRSGQFARVRLPGKNTQALFIPTSAVISFGQMEKVFVVREDIAHLRLVRTGSHDNGLVEILSGLSQGEWVVVDNNHLLVNGQPLQTSR